MLAQLRPLAKPGRVVLTFRSGASAVPYVTVGPGAGD
jgi:hypothetical protein